MGRWTERKIQTRPTDQDGLDARREGWLYELPVCFLVPLYAVARAKE